MNVNFQDNVSLRSSMVGVPQQLKTPQQIEEQRTIQYRPIEAEEGEKTADSKTKDAQNLWKQGSANKTSYEPGLQERKSPHLTGGSSKGQNAEITRPGFLMDNSSMINFKFQNGAQSAQASQTSKSLHSPFDPRMKKKQFVGSMKKMIDLELKQFVKSDDNQYTRAGLRTILKAIDPDESKPKKADPANYNLQNINKVMTAMRAFEDNPSFLEETQYL